MLTYSQAMAFLYERLPMFGREGASALKVGLTNISAFCEALGQPQNTYPTVHVAGTNGKGSTCHLLAGALQEAGYKVGLYTSPHLVDFRERFRINGRLVSKERVCRFISQNETLIEELQPSYFELAVAMAFQIFKEEKVDIAVIETGLGGRLDSTNIIRPVLSVITQISYDHTDILGDTLELIAGEKAGIIKPHTPVVIGETQEETKDVFIHKAHEQGAEIVFADQLWQIQRLEENESGQLFEVANHQKHRFLLKSDLLGAYQGKNLLTACVALRQLEKQGWRLTREQILQSFTHTKALTGLRGRWEILNRQPKIILEVGHNPGGLQFLIQNLRNEGLPIKQHLKVVLGFVKDKDLQGNLAFFPKEARYYFTQAQVPRALPAERLQSIGQENSLHGRAYPNLEQALLTALSSLEAEDVLLVAGSFYIVGEAIPILEQHFKAGS